MKIEVFIALTLLFVFDMNEVQGWDLKVQVRVAKISTFIPRLLPFGMCYVCFRNFYLRCFAGELFKLRVKEDNCLFRVLNIEYFINSGTMIEVPKESSVACRLSYRYIQTVFLIRELSFALFSLRAS